MCLSLKEAMKLSQVRLHFSSMLHFEPYLTEVTSYPANTFSVYFTMLSNGKHKMKSELCLLLPLTYVLLGFSNLVSGYIK